MGHQHPRRICFEILSLKIMCYKNTFNKKFTNVNVRYVKKHLNLPLIQVLKRLK